MTPAFEKRPRLSALEHAGSAHDDHRIALLLEDPLIRFQIVYVAVLEGVVDFLVEPLLDLLAEHIDVGLVNVLALLNQRDSVIDVDVCQLTLLPFPILVEDEQELLGPACREHRQQTLATTLDYLPDFLFEHLFADGPVLVYSDAKSTL